jgi:hypothetical protein
VGRFAALRDDHTRVVSNLHPDTLPAIAETLASFGALAGESALRAFDLIVLLDYDGRTRRVREVWDQVGGRHALRYAVGAGSTPELKSVAGTSVGVAVQQALTATIASGVLLIPAFADALDQALGSYETP